MPQSIKYSEEELIELLKNSNAQAFAYLYDHYSGALYNVIFRILDNHTLAEEVLQEVFVKIWNHISNYDHRKGRLFPWMLNLTRNLIIDTVRTKSYRKQAKVVVNEIISDPLNNDADLFSSLKPLAYENHYYPLNNVQKQVIELAYFEGLNLEQLSNKVAQPVDMITTTIKSGILELRNNLPKKID